MDSFIVSPKKRHSFDLNVVPLIDVLFVLLLFTLLTSNLTKQTGVDVDKPQAQSAGELSKQSILVAITREGNIHVNERQVDLAALQTVVSQMLVNSSGREVVLVADQKSETGILVSVMDACNLAGAKKISVAAMAE